MASSIGLGNLKAIGPDGLRTRPTGRRGRGAAACAVVIGLSGLGVSLALMGMPAAPPAEPPQVAEAPVEPQPAEQVAALPEPEAAPFLGDDYRTDWRRELAEVPLPGEDARPAEAPAQPEAPAANLARSAPAPMMVPLPVPRPPELAARPERDPARTAARRVSRRQAAVAPAPVQDERSFIEKLFGMGDEPKPALAYAALGTNAADKAFRSRIVPPTVGVAPQPAPPVPGNGVAVYDIKGQVVILPNGERLEAHSGLGSHMDDPDKVHVRMKGATPPGTYDLTERETLFHGVRAIRMTPVGGSEAIHNRTGILAHSYMLGPNGASNGCVSFKDYNKFLQAYLSGQVQRIVVVASR